MIVLSTKIIASTKKKAQHRIRKNILFYGRSLFSGLLMTTVQNVTDIYVVTCFFVLSLFLVSNAITLLYEICIHLFCFFFQLCSVWCAHFWSSGWFHLSHFKQKFCMYQNYEDRWNVSVCGKKMRKNQAL